jgi:8-oxo-dGTP pyrophosphatase MutT (NUDIX family)
LQFTQWHKLKVIQDSVLESPKFKRWKRQIDDSGTQIDKLEVLASISRQKGDLFCALIDTTMITPEGNSVPRCMLLRGMSVVVVPVFYCDDGEIYTLMVKQSRPVDGLFTFEFPGGILDKGNEAPIQIAALEVREELGLDIDETKLIPLNPEPISVCTALLDEKIHFFYFEKQCTKSFLDNLNHKKSGIAADGEFIQISVVPMREANKIYISSVLIGLKLLENILGHTF